MTEDSARQVTTARLVWLCAMWLAAWSGWNAVGLARLGVRSPLLALLVPAHFSQLLVRPAVSLVAVLLLATAVGRIAVGGWTRRAVVLVGVAAALFTSYLPVDARSQFEALRPQLDEVANLPEVRSGPSVYYFDLPAHLAGVSFIGRVTVEGDGSVFVPLWAGIPDDAGGYWYTPGESPEGRDMWGMICEDPTRLDGDWWACGVKM